MKAKPDMKTKPDTKTTPATRIARTFLVTGDILAAIYTSFRPDQSEEEIITDTSKNVHIGRLLGIEKISTQAAFFLSATGTPLIDSEDGFIA